VDAELFQEIARLAGPTERVLRANQLIAEYQATVAEISRLRREALEELMASGRTQTEIAAELGMTRARVGQLLSSCPRPERAFLGTGTITVALGGKREANSRGAGRVVAQEDMKAYDHLRELAKSFSLNTTYETVEPPGMLNLNRDNLIVICGPRLSPLLAQVLESDRSLGFENDHQGWHLVDRVTEAIHRSPMDIGQHRDYAYLGRLPRLDGRGLFLYIAGIHAMGAACVIHYLENNLAELYSEVKIRRFSTLISGDFDSETLEVSSSRRLTPLYRHENG